MRSIIIFLVATLGVLILATTTFNHAQSTLEPYEAVLNNRGVIENVEEFNEVQAAFNDLSNRFILTRLFIRDELQLLNQRLETFDMVSNIEFVTYVQFLSPSNPRVTIEVEGFGAMTLELFPEVAPNSVNNMIQLIQNGYYDGLVFHRIILGFMIQGGWGDDTGCVIPGEFVANQVANPLKHTRGVLSMARTNVFDSATSQFFIVHRDSLFLDRQYAAFGVLVEGFDVLDAIAGVATGFQDRPTNDVVMTRVTVDLGDYTPQAPICVTP